MVDPSKNPQATSLTLIERAALTTKVHGRELSGFTRRSSACGAPAVDSRRTTPTTWCKRCSGRRSRALTISTATGPATRSAAGCG